MDVVVDGDAAGRLVPLARIREADVGANGGDDSGSGGHDLLGRFDDVFEGWEQIAGANLGEPRGMGMAIEHRVAGAEIVATHNCVGTVPADEGIINRFAFGMIANGAFAAVAFGIGRGSGTEGFAPGKREILSAFVHFSSTKSGHFVMAGFFLSGGGIFWDFWQRVSLNFDSSCHDQENSK